MPGVFMIDVNEVLHGVGSGLDEHLFLRSPGWWASKHIAFSAKVEPVVYIEVPVSGSKYVRNFVFGLIVAAL